jgi:hypothetical protein
MARQVEPEHSAAVAVKQRDHLLQIPSAMLPKSVDQHNNRFGLIHFRPESMDGNPVPYVAKFFGCGLRHTIVC